MFVTILKKYVWVVNLLLLTGLAYIAALTVNQKIQGAVSSPGAVSSRNHDQTDDPGQLQASERRPRSHYEIILTRNIFGITDLSDSSPSASVGDQESLPDTTLNIVLLGTIINPDTSSVAIIKNPDNNKVQGYRNGEEIDIINSEKVNLIEVMSCSAVIRRQRTGHETIKCKNLGEEVASSRSASPSGRIVQPTRANARSGRSDAADGINKISDNEYEISRELLEDVLSDPTNIVQQARVIPQSDGLRFFGIRSNSIFWKIGIKNGDTIHKINNVELNDVERALGIFEELRSQSSFSIDFTRAGKQYSYQYVVK